MGGFFKKFAAAFAKLFGQAPQWVHFLQSVVAFAGPVFIAIASGFAPELAGVAAPIITEIKADLATLSVLAGDGTATPTLTATIERINANLGELLTAGHIKNPTAQAQAQLVVSELQAVLGMLPNAGQAATAPAIAQ